MLSGEIALKNDHYYYYYISVMVVDAHHKMLNEGECVDVVYFDFKAFHKIPHRTLILRYMNVAVMQDILSRLKSGNPIESRVSDRRSASSGMPQRYGFCAILFIVYINDLDEPTTCPALEKLII